ncbi:hypothetical protein Tco_0971516 [Tanacetum coccineum]
MWEFYVNERTEGTIGDLDIYNGPYGENTTRTHSDTFYKPYLDAQEAKDIYEVINMEYSPIPILAHRDIDNPDDLSRTKEFTVVRHSIADDEEFVTGGPSKINTIKRTPGNMSCIYHELLNRKDRGWECADDVVDFRTWPGISLETAMISTMDLDGGTSSTDKFLGLNQISYMS